MTQTDARDAQTQKAVETGQAPAAVTRLLAANRTICQRLAARFAGAPPRAAKFCYWLLASFRAPGLYARYDPDS